MKRLFVVSILLLFLTGLKAQKVTEKWNIGYGRYEYYDSNGNMIGYKKQNVWGQWEYVDTSPQTNPTPKKKYEYKNPYNTELMERALSIKQQEFDRKVSNIQALIAKVDNEISLLGDEIAFEDLPQKEQDKLLRLANYIPTITSYEIDKEYDRLVYYFNDAYVKIRNLRIQERKKYQQPNSTTSRKKIYTDKNGNKFEYSENDRRWIPLK